jgi:Leucine-rich repeat (LRR) protein
MKTILMLLLLGLISENVFSQKHPIHYDIYDALKDSNTDRIEAIHITSYTTIIDDSIYVYLHKFKNLKTLWIKNKILKLPLVVCQLRNLVELNLSDNLLTDLPDEIINLKDLNNLDCSGNKFTSIPSCVFYLSKIKILDFTDNQITYISSKISKLKHLEMLSIGLNKIDSLPSEFCHLTKLFSLYIAVNSDIKLPSDFAKLRSLQFLDAGQCNWTKLPNEIYSLVNLQTLDLARNSISYIDVNKLIKLKYLEIIILNKNPISVEEIERIKKELSPKFVSF